MGTETACGSYFNNQSGTGGTGAGGGASEMTNYYQINSGEGPRNAANQSEDEMAQSASGSDQTESELDLRQQDQQRHLHSSQSPRNPSTNSSNPWSISQQIQNHITSNSNLSNHSRLERSNSLTANWTFPSYQRLYNENHYGIAIAAAVQQQQQLPGIPQNNSSHNTPMQHHGNATQLHHHHQQQQQQQQLHHQQQQQHQQSHQHHQTHPQQQQQQQQQLQQNSHHLAAIAEINQNGHPQFSKRFYYPSGKSSNNKDICGDDKHKEDGDPWNVEAQAAFLGPNLWDKTLPYDSDLKVHQYADLDEFLSENGIPVDGLPGSHLGHSTSLTGRSDSLGHCAGLSLGLSQVTTKRERSPSPSDCMSPDTINPPSPADSIFDVAAFSMSSTTRDFDPRTRAFSDEELKPQPMIKKSRKQFVPDDMKDDKYWARRRKNNMAAKRSRDARRMKENQIALRAGYLEKENMNLHREVEQLKQENMELRARLSKYQEV
ncbi:protein kinase 4 isoform X3 [Wyeomyia smithii]|uniref:protein kinase 4 isoform X3 n=1 Tax=Wyeomyia smithii TaxID=174621 RepID=UPI002467F767|nr:protein kinase 4 isoform X3 [Wyeomyia smithii]